MTFVTALWVLAMLSGLSWARRYTNLLTAATLAAFLWAHPSGLKNWLGWLELAVLGLTPWLLANQRAREEAALKQLHGREAEQMAQLSEAARSLLSLQTSTQQMESHITEITDLYHVTKETVRAMRVQELFAASLSIAPRFLNARGLRLIDLSVDAPVALRASRAPDGRMTASSPDHLQEVEQAIVAEATAAGRASGAIVQERPGCAWVTLWRDQQPIGVLVADGLPEPQRKTLSILANQLSLQFSRIHLYRQVEALAVTDALTGLSVRSSFMERAAEELARSKRHRLSCALLMTDLDLFKQKNDTFGHLVGDVVLRDVARLLQRNLREIDLIARYGGEEFILLLIETEVGQAMLITQRLKQLVEVHPIRAYDELLTQTISIGVAAFPEDAETLEALIERADQALYTAKRAGRNRVVRWSGEIGSSFVKRD